MSQPPVSYGASPWMPRRPPVSGGHVATAWVAAVLSCGYMLPWAVAATRQKSSTLAIALVNLLVGWTLVGWAVALVMACTTEPTVVAPTAYGPLPSNPPPGWYPDGAGHRYWDGNGWTDQASP